MLEIPQQMKSKKFTKAVLAVLVLLSIFLFTKILTELKEYRFIGAGMGEMSIISFSGEGEVFAAPDIATISFTVSHESKSIKESQDEISKKVSMALELLDDLDIEDEDIKTERYNFTPVYNYTRFSGRELTGYRASQNISVKIRDLDIVADVLSGLGKVEITNLDGPNFAIEDEDALKSDARNMAIKDAKEKAMDLARDLGVRLVRIVNFSGSGGYIPYPQYDAFRMDFKTLEGAVASLPSPEIPTGENRITSNVTITYEIR